MSTLLEANTDLVTTAATILGIVLLAFVTSQLVRRSIKKTLRSLSQGTVKERLGAGLRPAQRGHAVIWTIAVFLVLGQVGVNLGPLIAGAGIVGVALGFGSQSLVKDFISGVFILIEDQFGVGDLVDLGEATEIRRVGN